MHHDEDEQNACSNRGHQLRGAFRKLWWRRISRCRVEPSTPTHTRTHTDTHTHTHTDTDTDTLTGTHTDTRTHTHTHTDTHTQSSLCTGYAAYKNSAIRRQYDVGTGCERRP
jgi:hypothetical protein